jgi:hypothetical protein
VPVNHNVFNEAKVINIAHAMIGNFVMAMRARFCRCNRWVMILV